MNSNVADSAQLHVIVVGAGIAGLGAAIVLRRAGHNVTLFERSPSLREVGFMVSFSANGTRVLRSLGFDFARAQAVTVDFIVQHDGKTLEIQSQVDVRNSKELYGDEILTFYRPDLLNELKRLAFSPDTNYPIPVLMLNSKVVQVDLEHAAVTLADGTVHTADLVVGADGERSTVRKAFDESGHLKQAPFKAFRTLIPTELIEADPKAVETFNLFRRKIAMFVNGIHSITWFDAHDGMLQDLEVAYSAKDKNSRKAVVTDKAIAKEIMLNEAKKYHPDLIRILQKAENVTDWEVHYVTPLARCFQSRAILIGDAAHSMFPTTGQGGCMTIEDIGTLGVVLSDLKSNSQIPERLEVFQQVRKRRTEVVQATSAIRIGKEESFFRKFGRRRFEAVGIKNTADHLDFLYNYDAIAEAKDALEKSQQNKALL